MKIVFLLCSPDINGGTNVILEHAGGLQRLGHEVTIATLEKVAPSRHSWHREGGSVSWKTLHELQGQSYDCAIATWWESPYLLSRIAATHAVYFVQSIESKFFPVEDPANLDTRDHSLGADRCNNGYYFSLPIITEASWIRDFLATHYNHEPYVVRNGIRKELYCDEAVIAPRKKGSLRVLIEGPVDVFHKNVPRTVELCRQAGVDEIWLLTSSPVESFPGVDRVFSRIPFDRTPPVYRSCDVLVKLSYVEGMFGPPLEMFHCGGTAIVYDVTGHDEYIRHGINGVVIERDDEQGVVDALRDLKTNDTLLASLCREASATAAEWPDWTTATAWFAEALAAIGRTRPISRTYLQNIAETFTTYQTLQLQSRELARFAQREQAGAAEPGTNDNFVQLYGDALVSDFQALPWAHYRCGERTEIRIPARIQGRKLQLRIDPSVRIGIILLYSLRIIQQADKKAIVEYRPQSGFDQLYLTGTAKWLQRGEDHWVVESYGNDPQLFLPIIEGLDDTRDIIVEVSMQEMGLSEYISRQEKAPANRSILSRLKSLGIPGLVVAYILMFSTEWGVGKPVPVILDTDISSDVDDAGAVAVLHSLANESKADILAMMVSAVNPSAEGCLHALNAYFGRPEIPIGVISGEGVSDESKYTDVIGKEFAVDRGEQGVAGLEVVSLYREILSRQPDQSVMIITIGYLTNLKNLLISGPDSTSPLTGRELVARKVKKLVTMGGQYPKGREWNFYQDHEATTLVVAEWPTPIFFCGFESGVKVLTGSGLRQTSAANPLRRSYELYNGLTDRSSWDQLTVLYGIEGLGDASSTKTPLFTIVGGTNTILPDGSNEWRKNPVGKHYYLQNTLSNEELRERVEQHMIDAIIKIESK